MSGHSRISLGVSILSFVGLAGLYFATQTWMPIMWGLLVPGVLGLVFWLYYDRKSIVDFFTMKSTKQGLNMGALILITLGFLTVINYVGAKYYKTFDFSGNQINSLSDQTKKLVAGLETDLQIKFFYKKNSEKVDENKKQFREVMQRYQDLSPKIQVDYVEMNEQAKLTQDFGANKGAGEAFVAYKGNKNRIENYTEQDVTNAIIKVTRTKKKNIYILEGHNERNMDQERDESGLLGFRQMLEKNSFVVKRLSFATQPEVPADADALLILGPIQNFQPVEIKLLENYLAKGGSVLLALEGKTPVGLQSFLARFGIEQEKFFVFNVYSTPMGQVVNAQSATVAVTYSTTSPITKDFAANQMTVFSQPGSLKIAKVPEGMKSDVLVKTPANSVALEQLTSENYSGEPRSFNLGLQVTGHMEKSDKEFNLVVFSDVDFMSNTLLYQNLNRDLALNAVAALVKEADLISISPKEPAATKILVSPPEFNQFFKFVVVGLFLPLPFVFLIISIVLWFRRRHA